MQTAIVGAMFSVLALGAADVEQAEQGSPPPSPSAEQIARRIELTNNTRDLFLRAFGSGEEKPGQLRVPIPTDQGVMYEIIIEKPGLPRSVPAIVEKTR